MSKKGDPRKYNSNNKKSYEYSAWRGLLRYNKEEIDGIIAFSEWRGQGGFTKFLDHVGLCPSDRHKLKMIDNDAEWVLRSGKTASSYKHGLSKAAIYSVWSSMIDRCDNINTNGYGNYGGRGIKVHKDFKGRGGFAKWFAEVGDRPSSHLSIDRIDNDGDYTYGNMKWSTTKEQRANTRVPMRAKNAVSHGTNECLGHSCMRKECIEYRRKISVTNKRLNAPKHGTNSKYTSGCRCGLCKKASAEYTIDYKLRKAVI